MAAVSLFWNTNMAAVTSVSGIRKKTAKQKIKNAQIRAKTKIPILPSLISGEGALPLRALVVS